MKISRRRFLQLGASAAASLISQRYDTIIKAIGGTTITRAGEFSRAAILDYYEMAMGVRSLVIDAEEKRYFLDNFLDLSASQELTLDDIPNLTQQALFQAYKRTVDGFRTSVIEVAHLLKYGDDLERINELMRSNMDLIVSHKEWGDRVYTEFELDQLEQVLSNRTQAEDVLQQVVSESFRHLNAIERAMTPDTLARLGQEGFLRIPGTQTTLPYRLNSQSINDMIEAISLDYNGVCLGRNNVSEPMRRLLEIAQNSDEVKNRIAKHVLWGDEGFFNYELAHKHGLEARHFQQGMRDLISENMERQAWGMSNDAESLESMLRQTDIHPDSIANDLDWIESQIAAGVLTVTLTQSFGEDMGGIYAFHSNSEEEHYLGDQTEYAMDVMDRMLTNSGFTCERECAHSFTIEVDGRINDNYWAVTMLDNYCKSTIFAAEFHDSPVQKLLGAIGWEGQTMTDIVASARQMKLFPG